MKGPSLPYELRVLRVFRCGACGRIVHLPAHATSHLCHCMDPPKFMQPQERPVTKSPDVSAFLSPADPSELVEEVETEEEPYVPYIPKLPPRPPQFPSRRKLSDEIDKFVPPEFGDGLESTAGQNKDDAEETRPLDAAPQRGSSENGGDRKERSDRRGSRGRDNADRRPDRRPERRPDSSIRNEQPSRSDTTNRPSRHQRDAQATPPSLPQVTNTAPTDADAPAVRESEIGNGSDRGRRNRRRRGRDRGTADNQSPDSRSPVADSNATLGDDNARNHSDQAGSDDDFGSGLESGISASASKSTQRSNQRPAERRQPEAVQRPASISDNSADDEVDGDDDGPDGGEIDPASASDPSAPRRRRNRRRGRRRGRSGNENSGEGPGPGANAGGTGRSGSGGQDSSGPVDRGPGPNGSA